MDFMRMTPAQILDLGKPTKEYGEAGLGQLLLTFDAG